MILLPLLLRAEHGVPSLGKKDACLLFLQAFAGNFLFSILLLYGLKLTSAAESGIILGTVPVVIGLISFLLLRESLTWNKGIALFIATVGVGAVVLSNLLLKEPMVWSHWVGIGSVLLAIVLMTQKASGSR